MSDGEKRRTEIERADSRRPRSGEDERSAPAQHSNTGPQTRNSANSDTLVDAVSQRAARPVSVDTGAIAATLVGVPRVELAEFVYDHQLDSADRGERRPVALFDLENRSDQPMRWRSARTKFIGDDEYSYQPSHVSLEPSRLGPGCHTRQVEIEPGHRARMVTMVEPLPEGVEVAKVVQTVTRRGQASNERLVFAVE